MAFGRFDQGERGRPMAEINMIPLIDVMLVLLVIFIITAPLLTHAVRLDLPNASSRPNLVPPLRIEIAIDRAGQVHWNGEPVDRASVRAHMAEAGAQTPVPEIQLRADRTTPYQALAHVLADAASAGLNRIGFVSEPD